MERDRVEQFTALARMFTPGSQSPYDAQRLERIVRDDFAGEPWTDELLVALAARQAPDVDDAAGDRAVCDALERPFVALAAHCEAEGWLDAAYDALGTRMAEHDQAVRAYLGRPGSLGDLAARLDDGDVLAVTLVWWLGSEDRRSIVIHLLRAADAFRTYTVVFELSRLFEPEDLRAAASITTSPSEVVEQVGWIVESRIENRPPPPGWTPPDWTVARREPQLDAAWADVKSTGGAVWAAERAYFAMPRPPARRGAGIAQAEPAALLLLRLRPFGIEDYVDLLHEARRCREAPRAEIDDLLRVADHGRHRDSRLSWMHRY